MLREGLGTAPDPDCTEATSFEQAWELVETTASAATTGETLIATLRDHIPGPFVAGMASTKARRLRSLLEKHCVPLPATEGLSDAQRIVQLLNGTFTLGHYFTMQPVKVLAEVGNFQKLLNVKFHGKWRRLATELRPMIQGFQVSAIPSVAGPNGQVHAFQFFLADDPIRRITQRWLRWVGSTKSHPSWRTYLKVLIPESQRSVLRQQFDHASQKKNQTLNQYVAELRQLVEVLDPKLTEAIAIEKFVDTCVAKEHVYFQLQARNRSGQEETKFKTLTAATEKAAQGVSAHAKLQMTRQKLATASEGETTHPMPSGQKNSRAAQRSQPGNGEQTKKDFKRKQPDSTGVGKNRVTDSDDQEAKLPL